MPGSERLLAALRRRTAIALWRRSARADRLRRGRCRSPERGGRGHHPGRNSRGWSGLRPAKLAELLTRLRALRQRVRVAPERAPLLALVVGQSLETRRLAQPGEG